MIDGKCRIDAIGLADVIWQHDRRRVHACARRAAGVTRPGAADVSSVIHRVIPGQPLATRRTNNMIILGVILLIIGIVAHIAILTWIGVILLVVGAVLFIAGSTGRAIGGRKYWY
jgi:small-conductance mechanosensitive channel